MDDHMSASELRQRYHKDGTARDDELSAAQLKARYGIAANSKDFSTKHSTDYSGVVLVVVAVLAGVGFLAYFFVNNRA